MALLFDVASKAAILAKKKEKRKWYEHDIWRNPLVVAGLVQPIARQISGTLDAALNRPVEKAEAAWNASEGVASTNRKINKALIQSQIFSEDEAQRVKANKTVEEWEGEKLRTNWITRGRRTLANLDPEQINPKTAEPYVLDQEAMLSDDAVFSFFNTYKKEDPDKPSPYEQQLAKKIELRNKLIQEKGDLTTPEHYATLMAHHTPVAQTLPGRLWNVLSNNREARYDAAIKNLEKSPALRNVGEFIESVEAYNEGNASAENVFITDMTVKKRQALMARVKPDWREAVTITQETKVEKDDYVTYTVIKRFNPRTRKTYEDWTELSRVDYDSLQTKESREKAFLASATPIHTLVNSTGLSATSETAFYAKAKEILNGKNIANITTLQEYTDVTNELFNNFAIDYTLSAEFTELQKQGISKSLAVFQQSQAGRDLIKKAYTPVEELHPGWDRMSEDIREGRRRNQIASRQELATLQTQSQQMVFNLVVIKAGVGYLPEGTLNAVPFNNAAGSTERAVKPSAGVTPEDARRAWAEFNKIRDMYYGFPSQ